MSFSEATLSARAATPSGLPMPGLVPTARRLMLILSLLISLPTFAQWEPKEAPSSDEFKDNGGAPLVYYTHSHDGQHPDTAGLGDMIYLHVQNLDTLLEEKKQPCSALVLFIEGMAVKGLQPSSCSPKEGRVRYLLVRTPQSQDVWRVLLGRPSGYKREVSISIGTNDQYPIQSRTDSFQLLIIRPRSLFTFLGITAVGLLILVWLCRNHGLIRSGLPGVPVMKQPYNLSLFQMAFWFFLVIASYLFIWLINDELDTITDSILALLGIGAGTALASSLIDKNHQPASAQSSSATPAESGRTRESRGFLMDLLNDEHGISLHRFQLFVWTLVLGVIFCNSVYRNLQMPEFSATLLGLMGLSAGTFLGFKVPEGKKPGEPLVAPPATTPGGSSGGG
ncbi:MAG TPA: hypothetical protein VEY88_20830 [Archangium sp.]|nr:hypothetical protein [Archangium sp.]